MNPRPRPFATPDPHFQSHSPAPRLRTVGSRILRAHAQGLFATLSFAFALMTPAGASAAPATPKDPKPRARHVTIHRQPSWVIANQQVELAVTELGGHLAPVTFYRDSKSPVRPYHVSPWQDEKPSAMPAPVLVPLRGDFFCLPFGGNQEPVGRETHPPHGEVSSARWKLAGTRRSGDVLTLALSLQTTGRTGRVTKELSLVDGHDVVYSRHVIEGFAGRAPVGHHATLAMPASNGAVRIATSPFRFGMTCPSLFSDPRQREYQALLPGAKWTDLSRVPAAWKTEPDADLTRQPGRTGHADLVQLVHEPWAKTGGPAWVTATRADEGWLWFALKDADVLNSTVFWMENRGRHGHPWNGRNNCLGLEDVTAFFADGLAAATRENALTREGVPTSLDFTADRPTAIHYIQGVVKIPPGFDVVASARFSPGQVTFISASGREATAPVRHEFLRSGTL